MHTKESGRFTPTTLDHAARPRNFGPMEDPDGHAILTGPCGETVEFWIRVRDDRIQRVHFTTDGCGSARACGSILTTLVEGRTLEDAVACGQSEILRALGGLPAESAHCALLASTALAKACADAREKATFLARWVGPREQARDSAQSPLGAGGAGASARQPITLSVRHGHAHCILCGQNNPSSWGVRFDAGEGNSVHGTMRPNTDFQGYDGILHGGVIAALLDAAMTHCLFHIDVQAVTGDLHVRFLQPVSASATIDVRAHVISATSRVFYLRSELCDRDRLMAWGEGTFVRRNNGDGRR